MNSNKSFISIFSSDYSPAPSPADPLKLFKEALNDGVNQIQSHPDMCCSAMLSSLSIAAQGLINVQTLEGRAKPVSICTLTSARSGDRKTSTDNYYFVPIKEYEKFLFTKSKNAAAIIQAAHYGVERKKKFAIKQIDEALENSSPIEPAVERLAAILAEPPKYAQTAQLLYTNTSLAGLLKGLAVGWPNAGLITSEGGSILNAKMADLLPYLSILWDGDNIKYTRANKSFDITDARLTLSIMIQPEILRGYLGKSAGQARTSGFLSRCLVSEPPSLQGNRMHQHPENTINTSNRITNKTPPAVAYFHNRILTMLHASMSKPDKITLKFNEQAQRLISEFYNKVESELGEGGRLYDIGDCASKITENLCRIAALLHYFSEEVGDIGVAITEYAIELCVKYLSNFKCMFGFLNTAEQAIDDGHKIIAYLRRKLYQPTLHGFNSYGKIQPSFILKSDLERNGPLRDGVDRLDAALHILMQEGFIFIHQFQRSCQIAINPNKFHQYQQQHMKLPFTQNCQ